MNANCKQKKPGVCKVDIANSRAAEPDNAKGAKCFGEKCLC